MNCRSSYRQFVVKETLRNSYTRYISLLLKQTKQIACLKQLLYLEHNIHKKVNQRGLYFKQLHVYKESLVRSF